MTKVRIMNHKGDEQSVMSPSQVMELMCKMGKSKYFIADAETNEVIKDISTIRDDQTITIIPVVAGG